MMSSMENTSVPENTVVLDVRGLTVTLDGSRGPQRVVDGIDLTVHRGEVFALLGESGSGKSMTARAIMGLIDNGTVEAATLSLGDTDLLTVTPEQHRRLRGVRVSLVMQDALSALNPVLSIGDQIIDLIRAHTPVGRREAEARAVELLTLVGIPSPEKRVRDYPHQFSGGQRQRILIAMAIALDPDLIIADEPTTALDVTVQAQILDLLLSLRDRLGMGVLLITHDLGVVMEVADRVAVMRTGRIVESGPADDVLTAPQHPYTLQLLDSMPQDVSAAADDDGSAPILEGRGLERTFRSGSGRRAHRVTAVGGVDLSLRSGEILAIVGESGSGKSVALMAVAQLSAAGAAVTAQELRFDGDDVLDLPPAVMKKRLGTKIGVVFQDSLTALNPALRVGTQLAEIPRFHARDARGAAHQKAVAALKDVAIDEPERRSRQFPHEYSGGMRQRALIAMSQIGKPRLIIADEPTTALDVTVQQRVLALLRRECEETGAAAIVV
ncbi:MAG: ABC transporter ATP-binding protein, partial [Microbacterium sp.]|nr:ABC transporter ATP-binding protein [Microbacterium sp.]